MRNPDTFPIVLGLKHDPDPAEVCGGVWVDERQRFVPVGLNSDFHDEKFGHSLWEYAEINPDTGEFVPGPDSEPVIRACLLRVPPGGESPAWHIRPDAGNGKYREVQQTVAGTGEFFHQNPAIVDTEVTTTNRPLPELPGEHLGVFPGDTIQVQAQNSLGVLVLATFPDAPFKLEYEERVPSIIPEQ